MMDVGHICTVQATPRTQYNGTGEEESVLNTCLAQYTDDWLVALYRVMEPYWMTGAAK